MQSSLDFTAILLLAGAAQGVLLSAALLTMRRGPRLANRLLGLLLLLFAANITLQALAYTRHLLHFPHLAKIDAPLAFLFGPLIYLYVKALTEKKSGFERKSALHFLPAIIGAAVLTPFYLQSAHDKAGHIMNELAATCETCIAIAWLTILQLLVYLIAAIRILRRHALRIRESFSSLEKINLNWLRILLIAYGIDWLAAFAWQLYGGKPAAANYLWILVSLIMYAIGYMGWQQPEIFSGTEETADETTPQKKYEKSTLTSAKAEEYHQKLLHLMAAEKPYRNRDLTLPRLAQRLAISSHHLSQIINDRLQQNFFEFVNGHRVEEAKRLLLEPANANINIAEIGFTAGFSSVSAFNAAFKKHAGLTPSQFRRNEGKPLNVLR
jgi:AraC-like DNA-binding protein